MAETSICFEFQELKDRATVGIDGVSFVIIDNGVRLSSSSGPVTLESLSVASQAVMLNPGTTAITDATIRVHIASSGDEMPAFIGGPLSLPDGAIFTVSVERGGTAQFTSDNHEWSVQSCS